MPMLRKIGLSVLNELARVTNRLVASTDKAATFRVRMETGAAELKTWFLAEDKSERGACYEYVSGPE